MTPQNQLAFILEVKPDSLTSLSLVLDQIAIDPAQNKIFPFTKSKTTHFARWVIFPAEEGIHYLVFSSNYDGQSRKKHLKEWLEVNESGFDVILSHCKDYDSNKDSKYKLDFLYKKLRNPAAFYIGTRGKSIEDIQKDFELRDFIRDFLDTKSYAIGDEKQIVKDIKELVSSSSKFNWAMKKSRYPLSYQFKKVFQWLYDMGRLAVLTLILITGILGVIIIPILFITKVNLWIILSLSLLTILTIYTIVSLRLRELKDGLNHDRISQERAHELQEVEDIFLQNQMTHLVQIKACLLYTSPSPRDA